MLPLPKTAFILRSWLSPTWRAWNCSYSDSSTRIILAKSAANAFRIARCLAANGATVTTITEDQKLSEVVNLLLRQGRPQCAAPQPTN